jgi:hypothetical protein
MIYSGLHLPANDKARLRVVAQDPRNLDIALRQGLSIAPPDWQSARVTQARGLHAEGNSAAALRLLEKQVPWRSQGAAHPGLSVVTLYAEVYTALHRYPEALAAYRYLLEHSEDFYEIQPIDRLRMQGLTYMNMAWIEQQQTHDAQALAYYSESIECLGTLRTLKTPTLLNALMVAYQQRGQVHRRMGKVNEALQDLHFSMKYQQQLLERDIKENLVKDWLDLGQTQLEQGDLEAAQQSLQSARRDWQYLQLKEAEALLRPLQNFEAQLAMARGQFTEAGQLYEKMAEKSQPLHLRLYALLMAAEAYFHEDSARGVALCEALVPQVLAAEQGSLPDVPTSALTLPLLAAAELCENHQQWELALTYYQFALRSASQQHNEYWLQAAAGRARMLEQQEDLPRLVQAYRDILRHLPTEALASRAEFALKLALAYQSSQKLTQAASSFEVALAYAQDLYHAEQQLQKTEVLHADHVWVRTLYFRAFFFVLAQHNPAAAVADLERIEAHLPGYAAYDLACLAAQSGAIDTAFALLKSHCASVYALPIETLASDEDLAALQADPRWQTL